MARPAAFVGNEADNDWAGWFLTDSGLGVEAGEVLEAAISISGELGAPQSIALAVTSYGTADSDPLVPALQVPAGNGDGDVQQVEYVIVNLADIEITIDQPCPADFDGDNTCGTADLLELLAAWGAACP
jgi:hypothetical protein